MFLSRLKLLNFRNYPKTEIQLHRGLNFIYGDNAQGKTSLLEAIHLLILGRSFRTNRLSEMLMLGQDHFKIEAKIETRHTQHSIKTIFDNIERKLWINQTLCRALSELMGQFPAVVISPNDDLVKGSPQSRRLFLDLQLSQTDPSYLFHLGRYVRAKRQRNQLLKVACTDTLDSWEEEMSISAAYISCKRHSLTQSLEPITQRLYESLSGGGSEFKIRYSPPFPSYDSTEHLKELFQKKYRDDRQKETEAGTTLFGPHRDDLHLLLSSSSAKAYGSEGQKRTGAITLRLASWHLLKEQTGENPLLFIDDLGDCLDEKRRQQVLNSVAQLGQVLITSTHPLSWEGDSTHFYVEQGSIRSSETVLT